VSTILSRRLFSLGADLSWPGRPLDGRGLRTLYPRRTWAILVGGYALLAILVPLLNLAVPASSAFHLPDHAVALGGNQHAGHARAFAAKIAQDVDRAADFSLGFGQRLALFASHLRAELLELAVQDVGGFVEQITARRGRHRRPGWERRRGCSCGIRHFLRRAL